MPLRSFQPGSKFNVYAYVEAGPEAICPVASWMRALTDQAKRSFTVTIKQHAEDGPLRDKQKSEFLEHEIYEFKCHVGPGYRILWFYLPGGRTVLTHGFNKGAKLRREIDRARVIKASVEADEK